MTPVRNPDKPTELNASRSLAAWPYWSLDVHTGPDLCAYSMAGFPRDTPGWWFPKRVVLGKVVSELPENLLKMQIHGPYCSPTELETLDPAICVLLSPQRDSGTCSTLRDTALGVA